MSQLLDFRFPFSSFLVPFGSVTLNIGCGFLSTGILCSFVFYYTMFAAYKIYGLLPVSVKIEFR